MSHGTASLRGNNERAPMAKHKGGNDDGWGKTGIFTATRYTKLRLGDKKANRGYVGKADTVCRSKWNKERCEVCRFRHPEKMECFEHPDWEISGGLVCDDFKKVHTPVNKNSQASQGQRKRWAQRSSEERKRIGAAISAGMRSKKVS